MNKKLKLAIGLFGTLGTFVSQSAFATCTENTASISSSLRDSGGATCISNTSSGSITTTANFGLGIATSNPLNSISNSGSITTSGDDADGIRISNQVDLLNNTGSITTSGEYSSGISNISTILTFNNGGTINTLVHGVRNEGTIQTIINSLTGVISTNGNSYSAIYNQSGYIGSIINQGLFNNRLGLGIANNSNSTIDTINNTSTGSIVGIGSSAIANFGTINNIINSGVISHSGSSSSINNHGVIGTITNNSILNDLTYNGIVNSYTQAYPTTTINTLNNSQGAGNINGELRYYGMLPTNYNIIINSTSNYGQLHFTDDGHSGSTSFGISSLSGTNIGIPGTRYQDVLKNISANLITNENIKLTYANGSHTAIYMLVQDDQNDSRVWDLLILSILNNADTQSSLNSLATKLRGAFSGQTMATNFANMNTYDCNLFDEKGLCISVGGQQTYVDSPSANMTSAVVVAGYKVSPTLRVGGFLNQNVNSNTGSNVDISNNSPLMGLFAVWNQNENHLGYQVKIANAYQDMDVTTTRDVIGTSEAGRGNTELNTQSYLGELSYAFLANDEKTLVRPYAAVRYTRIKQDAYSEEATSAVTAPLTYSALSDRSTSALVGVKVDHKLAEKLNLKASLGVEQDLYHHVDNLTATGISGLTSENFNDNIKRTRPVASIGAYYMPVKNQRIAADIYYQELPFQSTASATAYVNYMIGF